MPYFSSFLNPIHKFVAFTILKFVNGISFSSLHFNLSLNHEVNLISVSLKLHATLEHFTEALWYIYLIAVFLVHICLKMGISLCCKD